jgi:hypothetical protein
LIENRCEGCATGAVRRERSVYTADNPVYSCSKLDGHGHNFIQN